MAEKDDYLVDILVDLGFVSPEKVGELRREAAEAGVGVVDLMVANNVVRPADVTQAKAAHFGAEVVTLSDVKIEDDVISAIPRNIARKYRVIPVYKHDNSITVALADPSDLATLDSLSHLLHADIDLRVASEADIEAALSKYYAERGGAVVDPRLKEAIEDITREHVEVEASALADGAVVKRMPPSSNWSTRSLSRRSRCALRTFTWSRCRRPSACVTGLTVCCTRSRLHPNACKRRRLLQNLGDRQQPHHGGHKIDSSQ